MSSVPTHYMCERCPLGRHTALKDIRSRLHGHERVGASATPGLLRSMSGSMPDEHLPWAHRQGLLLALNMVGEELGRRRSDMREIRWSPGERRERAG